MGVSCAWATLRPECDVAFADPRRRAAIAASLALAGCSARSELPGASSCSASPAPDTLSFGQGVISSVAADRAGYPVAAGALDGTFDPTLFHTVLVPLLGDLFLTRYAPDGCDPFAVTFPVTPTGAWTQSFQLAISARGAIAVTASYQGLIDFGGGPVGSSELGPSAALAMLDGEGHHQWSSAWRADGLVSLARPAFDAQGNVFVAGLFSGQLTLHGASIGASAPGLIDGFVAKVDPLRRRRLVDHPPPQQQPPLWL